MKTQERLTLVVDYLRTHSSITRAQIKSIASLRSERVGQSITAWRKKGWIVPVDKNVFAAGPAVAAEEQMSNPEAMMAVVRAVYKTENGMLSVRRLATILGKAESLAGDREAMQMARRWESHGWLVVTSRGYVLLGARAARARRDGEI